MRCAAAEADGTNTITFNCGTATIPLTGYISVKGNMTVDGGGRVTLSGGGAAAFFQVFASGSLTLRNITLERGVFASAHPVENFGALALDRVTLRNSESSSGGVVTNYGTLTVQNSTFAANETEGDGGAIACESGSLLVESSTFYANRAGRHGGAIASRCDADVLNSTLSGNRAGTGFGGGFYQEGNGVAAGLTFVTVANNRAVAGAGVYNEGSGTSSIQLSRTMLAGNRLHGGALANCDGAEINSLNYNVEDGSNCGNLTQSGDARNAALPLLPLGGYGGPTQTHLPLPGSAAINRVPAAACSAADQRGVGRPQGATCDSGAVEFDSIRIFLPVIDR